MEPDSARILRDGAGRYLKRRRRLYDTCTHPRNIASARWGVFSAATVHEPHPVPRTVQNCPVIFVDPKYGAPQRPISFVQLSRVAN